ncbi:MAG: SDR family oxidoreductase [Actinobacteria bacterium]|nr:SDR family oxidoreductase [Actinomycetota bacterium]
MTDERTVLVTGASTGIGAATTARLVAAGYRVTSLDIKDAPPTADAHVHCDLSDPASIDAALASLEGPFHSLLNIAGVPGTRASETVIRVNVLGLRHLTEAVWDRIADGGTVVNVASIAGNNWRKRYDRIAELLATPDYVAGVQWWEEHRRDTGTDPYTFSKEAVVVYTMMLAGKGLSRGIRANDVGPGPVDTPLLPAFTQQVGESQMQWVIDQIGRPGRPDDIAQALVWLAVGDHDWINGQHLIVDGGFTAGVWGKWVDRASAPASR